MDQLPRLGKRVLIYLLLFTCNYVVSVWRDFLFLWDWLRYFLWHSLSLPYNYLNYNFEQYARCPDCTFCFTWSLGRDPRTSMTKVKLPPLSLAYGVFLDLFIVSKG